MRKFTKAEAERMALVGERAQFRTAGRGGDSWAIMRANVRAILREASRIEASKRKVKR